MGRRTPQPHSSEEGSTPKAIALIVGCTLLVTLAQATLKAALMRDIGVAALVRDPLFLLGLALMVVSGVLLTLALRHGDLSVVHPLLSLGFVWTVLAALALGERIAPKEVAGIAGIVAGVALIGVGGRKRR